MLPEYMVLSSRALGVNIFQVGQSQPNKVWLLSITYALLLHDISYQSRWRSDNVLLMRLILNLSMSTLPLSQCTLKPEKQQTKSLLHVTMVIHTRT